MTCVHCGLPHPSATCNRPEGVAARGAVLRMSERPVGWPSVSSESSARGRAKGGRNRRLRERIERAIGG